jgi:hypothetical protein
MCVHGRRCACIRAEAPGLPVLSYTRPERTCTSIPALDRSVGDEPQLARSEVIRTCPWCRAANAYTRRLFSVCQGRMWWPILLSTGARTCCPGFEDVQDSHPRVSIKGSYVVNVSARAT